MQVPENEISSRNFVYVREENVALIELSRHFCPPHLRPLRPRRSTLIRIERALVDREPQSSRCLGRYIMPALQVHPQ
jgi:hypothetical protein